MPFFLWELRAFYVHFRVRQSGQIQEAGALPVEFEVQSSFVGTLSIGNSLKFRALGHLHCSQNLVEGCVQVRSLNQDVTPLPASKTNSF